MRREPASPALAEPPRPLRADAEAAPSSDPSAAWLLALIEESKPYGVAAGRQERIWRRLQSDRPERAPRWRVAAALAALVASVLFGSAALAGWPGWLARAIGLGPATKPSPTALPVAPATARPALREVAPPPPSAIEPASAPRAEPAQPAPAQPRRAARPAPPAGPEETGILLEAMRALRVDRDPARARSLLSAFLERHPRSELAEEALVMLVEAAVARRDRDASRLADRYFKLYPRGPFRGQVERTLAAYRQ